MTNKDEYRLLRAAAEFVDGDPGTPGFAERAAASVPGSPAEVARALDEALTARERAGKARFAVAAGDVRVEPTSSGAKVSAGILAASSGRQVAAVRVMDADDATVAGVAMRVIDLDGVSTVITDQAGRADLRVTGESVFIQIGDYSRRAGSREVAASGVVALHRMPARSSYDYAAAHAADVLLPAADLGSWQTEAGGVAFSYQARRGGGDLTLLVRDEPAGAAAAAAGTHGVQFDTWGPSGGSRRWIVPLSPGPAGLAGSLYGTDERWLDRDSVQIREVGEFVGDLGDALDEVVWRSVNHADDEATWQAISGRMDPGRHRAAVESALEHRQSS